MRSPLTASVAPTPCRAPASGRDSSCSAQPPFPLGANARPRRHGSNRARDELVRASDRHGVAELVARASDRCSRLWRARTSGSIRDGYRVVVIHVDRDARLARREGRSARSAPCPSRRARRGPATEHAHVMRIFEVDERRRRCRRDQIAERERDPEQSLARADRPAIEALLDPIGTNLTTRRSRHGDTRPEARA